MKTLIILAIILGILAIYFVFNVEKSVSFKNSNGVVPAGTDIAKFVLNKILNKSGKINPDINSIGINNARILQSKVIDEIKSKIGDTLDEISNKAVDLIKKPIENKARELVCPIK